MDILIRIHFLFILVSFLFLFNQYCSGIRSEAIPIESEGSHRSHYFQRGNIRQLKLQINENQERLLDEKPSNESTQTSSTTSTNETSELPASKVDDTKTDTSVPVTNQTSPETMRNDSSSQSGVQCDESHCEDPKKMVSSCLRIPGEGTHKMSLAISYIGDGKELKVVAMVVAPAFLVSDQSEVSIRKGESETVELMMNPKVKSVESLIQDMAHANITVSTSYGTCQIALPIDYLQTVAHQRNPEHLTLFILSMPMLGAYAVILALLASAGFWLCYRFYVRKHPVETVKYQQLEMSEAMVVPQESTNEIADNWDESWDDDWEDSEAATSSSRLNHSLSSRGLAARRGNKDGWED